MAPMPTAISGRSRAQSTCSPCPRSGNVILAMTKATACTIGPSGPGQGLHLMTRLPLDAAPDTGSPRSGATDAGETGNGNGNGNGRGNVPDNEGPPLGRPPGP